MPELMLGASSFMQELLYISNDLVWKDEYTAQLNEIGVSSSDIELYMSAKRGELNFTVIPQFSRDVLIRGGVSLSEVDACVLDKYKIPLGCRDNCVKFQGEEYISKYVEKNNYYRQLYGLPDLDDTDVFYNTKYPDISDPHIPVHKLPLASAYNLESLGYFEELYKENPTKKYLRHLGKRKIEPYTSRNAERFSILYCNSSDFNRINVDFRDIYNQCRYSLLRSLYSAERRKENIYYDSFMAMMVLFMSIQQMLAKYLDADINRDFYDYESLKYVYDTYGVPFYPSIPLEYHIKIIKNINILIRYKGSTKVFYELFNIFNFGSMDVFDFYIMKTHKFEDGKPVFKYNADGSENLKEMYELKFGQVQLYNNPPLELSNPENILGYDTMTSVDPYWITDQDLLDKLYNTEFNYIESKYIGIRTVFDLMAITYESSLFFKMVFDNQSLLKEVDVTFNPLFITIDFYTLVIYACALICKRFGYEGLLNAPESMVAKILGFNFKANLDTVRADILANPETCNDEELLGLILGMNINSLSSINAVFGKIDTLRKLFIQRKFYAKSKDAFQAYSQLEKVLMISDSLKYAFPDAPVYDPNNAGSHYTFATLLSDLNIEMYSRYNGIHMSEADTEAIDLEIETSLILIRQNVSNLKYAEMYASSSSNVMIEHLFKLLDFFRSAKAELTGFTVNYNLGKRDEAALKLFCDAYRGEYLHKEYDLIDMLTDSWGKLRDHVKRHYEILFTDSCQFNGEILHLESSLHLIDRIHKIVEIFSTRTSTLHIHDILHRMNNKYVIKDKVEFETKADLMYEKIHHEAIQHLINDSFESLIDQIIKCTEINRYINKSEMTLSALQKSENSSYRLSDNSLFADSHTISDKTVDKKKSSFSFSDELIHVYEQIIPEQNSDN